MKKPLWIVFEGIDGSGKTTQAKMLSDYLNKNGIKTLYRHVFDSKAGEMLREMFINNSFSNTVEILILCATRQAFLDEITTEKDKYDVLVIDRFFMSILAMQGNDETDVELIHYIQNNICTESKDLLVYYMNTLPTECNKRLKNKGTCDRLEEKGVEFHNIVYQRYMALLKREKNVQIFNGNKDVNCLHIEIVERTLMAIDSYKTEDSEDIKMVMSDRVRF